MRILCQLEPARRHPPSQTTNLFEINKNNIELGSTVQLVTDRFYGYSGSNIIVTKRQYFPQVITVNYIEWTTHNIIIDHYATSISTHVGLKYYSGVASPAYQLLQEKYIKHSRHMFTLPLWFKLGCRTWCFKKYWGIFHILPRRSIGPSKQYAWVCGHDQPWNRIQQSIHILHDNNPHVKPTPAPPSPHAALQITELTVGRGYATIVKSLNFKRIPLLYKYSFT
jgi:hypothetical protein